MTHTIPEVVADANELFDELTAGLGLNLTFPEFTLPPEIPLPDEEGPAYEPLPPITVDQLTSQVVGGTGVFDVLMTTIRAHLAEEHAKNRITGGDYAKVVLGSLSVAMDQGTRFLLSRDRAQLENLQLQEMVKLAQAQRIKALVEAQTARAELQRVQVELVNAKLKAHTSINEFALSKMALVTGYNNINASEAQVNLVNEQVEKERAQTRDTHLDGTPILGLLGKQKELIDAQAMAAVENIDAARAQTKDTTMLGEPIAGLIAVDKDFKAAQKVQMLIQGELTQEQVEAARAQTRDTLSDGFGVAGLLGVEKQIKLAQKSLTLEQVEAARATTWETHVDGSAIAGIALHEKNLKQSQSQLVKEQYESQRGQTRGTLSTGEAVVGLIGAQTKLYDQQVISYKRDAESKALKLVMDTWVTRKTIDDGVAVPSQIDVANINTMTATYLGNLDLV